MTILGRNPHQPPFLVAKLTEKKVKCAKKKTCSDPIADTSRLRKSPLPEVAGATEASTTMCFKNERKAATVDATLYVRSMYTDTRNLPARSRLCASLRKTNDHLYFAVNKRQGSLKNRLAGTLCTPLLQRYSRQYIPLLSIGNTTRPSVGFILHPPEVDTCQAATKGLHPT